MQCPFCKEEIIEGAIKCKHCGSSLTQSPPPVGQPTSDFNGLISESLNLWKNNLADLVILTLVFVLVGWIPIANIGFITGYTRALTRVARGQGRAEVGDLFKHWDCFGNLFVYLLCLLVISFMLNFVPFLGMLASMCLGFIAFPGIYAIIDNKKSAIDAIKWSIETIRENFVDWLLAYIIGCVIAGVGFILLLVGCLLTIPLGQMVIIQQYERKKP